MVNLGVALAYSAAGMLVLLIIIKIFLMMRKRDSKFYQMLCPGEIARRKVKEQKKLEKVEREALEEQEREKHNNVVTSKSTYTPKSKMKVEPVQPYNHQNNKNASKIQHLSPPDKRTNTYDSDVTRSRGSPCPFDEEDAENPSNRISHHTNDTSDSHHFEIFNSRKKSLPKAKTEVDHIYMS